MAVILLSCLSFLTTLAGVLLAIRFRENTKGIAVGIGFSAGIMLVISFVELLPEAATATGTTVVLLTAILAGLLLLGLHVAIPHTHLIE